MSNQQTFQQLVDRYRDDAGLRQYQRDANSTSSMREGSDMRLLEDRDTRVVRNAYPIDAEVDFARLDHAISGICSEAGELAEHLKHVRFHGKQLDTEHLIKEFGDLLWYVAEGAAALGVTMAYIAARNIFKLMKRYPEGYFTVARSEKRDTDRE